tara:strand:+ start:161 stop:556 length:396 start_codon:yes stop_codon:yes gene_type:complete
MAGMDLTPKQQGFVDGIAKGDTQSDAYRAAYNTKNMTDKQIWEEASKLAASPKVSQRLFLLREKAAERNLVTIESLTKELEEARNMADALKNPAAMTGAIMGKAKLNGLLVEKVKVEADFNVVIAKEDADL